MKEEKDYIQKLAEIRSMMEQSSKFLSLSGWAGIMAGIYALVGAYIAYNFLGFKTGEIPEESSSSIYLLAIVILGFALISAIFFSRRRAIKNKQPLWNFTTRRLIIDKAIPVAIGAMLILILISMDLERLIVPLSLIFYGLALYNASKFTLNEVKILGIVQLVIGLLSLYFSEYSLLWWSLGFGLAHIVYGIYMHYKYER